MSDEEVLNTFEKLFKGYIENDIQVAISGGANYLAALGMFSYIEFLGGLLTGESGLPSKAGSNFAAAINLFPPEYQVLNSSLKVHGEADKEFTGIYDVLRCGLVHEYIPKGGAVIMNKPNGPIDDHTGIWIEDYEERRVIVLANNEFFRDFRSLIDNINLRLKNKEQPLFDKVKESVVRLASRRQFVMSPSASASASPSPSEEPLEEASY